MPADLVHPSDPQQVLLLAWTVVGRLTMPGSPEFVRNARRFTARTIGDHPRAEDALLLISEVVTNAVRHSRSGLPGGKVVVTVSSLADALLISTADDGAEECLPRVAAAADRGHGLVLVDALADQWGYQRDPAGTTVWFTLGGRA
ncbi:MAG: ATP-binding protein [Streptosporangiaceae bacterium]